MDYLTRNTTCLLVLVALWGSRHTFAAGEEVEQAHVAAETSKRIPEKSSFGKPSLYTVDHYDPRRDPFEDYQMTAKRAAEEDKLVLLQIGGNWCGWCHVLSRTFQEHAGLRTELRKNFLIMKVSVDGKNPNREFLSLLPPSQAFPHLFILKSDGTLLATLDPAPLETPRGYQAERLLAFLQQWTAAE